MSNVYAKPASPEQRLPAGSVSVVDLTAKEIAKTIDISPEAEALGCAEGNAITRDGRWLYFNTQCRQYADFAQDPIYIIDTNTDSVVDKINFFQKKLPNVGNSLAILPNGKQVWAGGGDACSAPWPTYEHVKNSYCGQPGGNPVTIIDASSRTIIRQIFFSAPPFISFSPDSKFAYLATDKEILAIETRNFEVVKHLAVAGASGSIAITRDGRYGYASIPSQNVVVRVPLAE